MTNPSSRRSTPDLERYAREVAPGRVNLIGEHTDYNFGLVLPMPIPQHTTVEIWPRQDASVHLMTADRAYEEGTYELGREKPGKTWIDYVQGLTQTLSTRGHALSGFDAVVTTTVPIGAGLASSAALEVAMLRALRTAFGLTLDDLEIARIGQASEVDFVGVPVGMMDQLASSLGKPGWALFIDTQSLETRDVKLPAGLEAIVITSGIVHAHGSGDFRQRRAECAQAAAALGVDSLREAQLSDLTKLDDPRLLRRARHVLTENERVTQTVQALASDDRQALRALFDASHVSMRDDFEVSIPEVDLLVELGNGWPGVVGARLTGGGFGGSVVMLGERERSSAAAAGIAVEYAARTGRTPSILLPLEEPERGRS